MWVRCPYYVWQLKVKSSRRYCPINQIWTFATTLTLTRLIMLHHKSLVTERSALQKIQYRRFDYMSPVTLNLKTAIQFVQTILKIMIIITVPSLVTKVSAVQMILSGKTLTQISILYCDCDIAIQYFHLTLWLRMISTIKLSLVAKESLAQRI